MDNSKRWSVEKYPTHVLFSMFFILAIILSLTFVSTLGVTPARNTLDYIGSSSETYSFTIINSEQKDMDLKLGVRGNLANYINLEKTSIHIDSSEEQVKVFYTLNLPKDLSPGTQVGEIIITQDIKSVEGENYIGATLAVVTQVYVYVPYPGKYAEAKLNVINADSNGDATFVISVASKGQFDLSNVYANIDVYSALNEKIDSFNTRSYTIKSGEKQDIIHKWKADVQTGNYKAKVALIYDDKIINLEDDFSVGEAHIELQELYVNDFSLGQIVKVNMLLENKWSEAIIGVHSIMDIHAKTGEKIDSVKSPDYDIEPLGKQILASYWDTIGVREGNYDVKITLEYPNKQISNNLEFVVKSNELQVMGLGYVISYDGRTSDSDSSDMVLILVIVVAILVLVNLLWFVILRKYIQKK